jgi:hypothetical protein
MRFDRASNFRYGVGGVKLGSKIPYIDRQGHIEAIELFKVILGRIAAIVLARSG